LITVVPPGSDPENADRRLTDLARQIAPVLPRYVPN
jgi:hypothetical protein